MPAPRRADLALTIAVAAVAGAVGAVSPASPTGRAGTDAVIVGLAIAVVTLAASSAPWWAVSILAGTALTIVQAPVLMVLGGVALAAALFAGVRPAFAAVVLAPAAGLALNVLARSEWTAPFGLSAAIAITAGAFVVAAGVRRRSRRVRRIAWVAAGILTVGGGAAVAGFGVAALRAQDELAAGLRAAEAAVAALERGDYEQATVEFDVAADVLAEAHAELSRPYAAPAALMPVLAQHRGAAIEMSGSGARGADVVARAVEAIDLDALRATDGRIDVAAIAALRAPFEDVRGALEDLRAATRRSRSPWLVGRAEDEMREFEASIAEHVPSVEEAIDAIGLAPGMLGAESPQRYLLLFTTPAEARGFGGFVGSYAELTVDDGRLRLGPVGRALDLDGEVAAADVRLDGPAGFLAQYGRFGFDGGGEGRVGDAAFRNLLMTSHFPWAGAVAADIYEQTTGRPVDGVLAMDPYVVAQFLAYAGPIELPAFDTVLTADYAAQYLLRDQYVLAGDDVDRRVDALGAAARLTFAAVLTGQLPDPPELANDLGPLARARRLAAWSPDAEEQALFTDIGLSGAIPELDGADGWSVTVTNSGGSKIDTFLERAAGYQSVTDPATGVTTATLRVRLTNTAPSEGLPRYVIGNGIGLPQGTSRLYVSVYSPLALNAITTDGTPTGVVVGAEGDWNVYSQFVDIPPGGRVTIELDLEGRLTDPATLVTWTQPMASDVAVLDGG